MFFLKARLLDIKTGAPYIGLISNIDAKRLDIRAGDELFLYRGKTKFTIKVDITSTLVQPGELGLFQDIIEDFKVKPGELLKLDLASHPQSLEAVREKLLGKKLSYKQIYAIVKDIVNGSLDDVETAFFIASAFTPNNFSREEVFYLSKAVAETGPTFKFKKKVADKHSTGGLPGNRVTPIIVAIIASYNICIPKTSSRAVTSAAGTADTFEVLAPVEFSPEEIKKLIKKNNACLVWGGEKIAPADDKFIRIAQRLGIEPYSKMVVSIMAKKVAMGVKYLILDIPVGKTAKISNYQRAQKIANLFKYLAKRFNIKIKIVIHKAKGPVGRGIGPALEARDVLRVLEQTENRPLDLEKKSVFLAGQLLELIGKAKRGQGEKMALNALKSGKALLKLKQIIKTQGGDPNITSSKITLGRYQWEMKSPKTGRVTAIHNKNLVEICRILGAPFRKRAGVYLNKTIGEKVKKNETLATLFTTNARYLDLAKQACKKIEIFKIK